jgi:general secretion pathway protein A
MRLIFKSSKDREDVVCLPSDRRATVPSLDGEERPSLLRVDLLDSYRDYFKFRETPFSVTPDSRFFFFSHSASEALNHLRYGVYEGLGFTMITGEPGTGKTMLLRYFLNKAGDDLQITQISHPPLSRKELLLTVLQSLERSTDPREDLTERQATRLLYDLLNWANRQAKKVVVLLDEAQGLDFELLEGLRLLSNLETDNRKLIQIVLFGQTELEEMLREKRLRQLDQRILVRYRLVPLQSDEIKPYIQHELATAKADKYVEFDDEAVDKIYQISGGLPRMVNVLCERAMMSAFVENTRKITAENVWEGWESLNGTRIWKV